MQSYDLHIVSEHLKRRHPYLEPPFKARYDPTEVHKSVFDRTIPKLIEILLTEDLPSNRYNNAFIILNELASDETEKSSMIKQGIVGIAAAYMHCQVESIRRESILLLGLLTSSISGLEKMEIEEALKGIEKALFDEELEVRNAISWTLCRIVLSRKGAEILCKNEITPFIIKSFLKYSSVNKKEEEYFILYFLHTFQHLLAYDDGIKSCLGTGLTKRLKELTQTENVYSNLNNSIIQYLSLAALSNIAINLDGKSECVQEEVIETTWKFLESQIEEEVAHATTLIMFTSINLTGKKQCIYDKEGKVDTKIIVKLIKLLGPTKTPLRPGETEVCKVNDNVKNDVKETLKIIAQEEDGFLAIAEYMAREAEVEHIESIFSSSIIIPLAKLLPKVSEVSDAPTLPSNKINDYKAYARIICHFLTKESSATEIGLNSCVDLVTKLTFFLCYRGDKSLQEGIAKSIEKLGNAHEKSKKLFKDLIEKYGEIEHKISKTTLSNEVLHYPALKAFLN